MAKNTPKKTHEEQTIPPMGENITLTLTVLPAQYQPVYAQVLSRFVSFTHLPGFRKGKAPASLVESHTGKEKIIEHVLDEVLPPAYDAAVKAAHLTPLVMPKIAIKSMELGKDWTFEATTAIAPEITLGDYQTIVKKTLAAYSPKEDVKPEEDKEARLTAIFQDLIKAIEPKIAPLLVEQEYERLLKQLAQTISTYRLDLETYLKHVGKTLEEVKQEYAAQALASLQLEFILLAITKDVHPEVSEQELDELLGDAGKSLSDHQRAHQREDAKNMLIRRKTIDFLIGLGSA